MDISSPKNHLAQLKMQKARLREFMEAVGATEEDIREVTEDADNLEAILEFEEKGKQFRKTIEKIWEITMYGSKDGEQRPEPPIPPVLILPHEPVIPGFRPRSETRNRRFKAAPGYTKEIGEALGLGKMRN